MPVDPLTADEQAAVIAAMLELTEQGDHEAAARLGELSKDPDAMRKAMAGDAPSDA